jgi:hypothetical protein
VAWWGNNLKPLARAMSLSTWFAFTAASIVLLLIPGPPVLLIVSYALAQGRRVAIATAAGVALGDFVAMTCRSPASARCFLLRRRYSRC